MYLKILHTFTYNRIDKSGSNKEVSDGSDVEVIASVDP